MGEPRRVVARDRGRRHSRAGAVAPRGARRDRRRLRHRECDGRRRRDDRRRRARAGNGADARSPRTARVAPTDGDQRAAGHRLDDLRAARDRDGRGCALRRALRLPRAVAVDARVRRLRARPRAARADRVRPALHPALCDLGGAARAPVPHLVGDRRRRLEHDLEHGRRGRAQRLAGRGRRRRDHGLVGAVRRGLHEILEVTPRRADRHRARLLRARRVVARTRCGAGALTRPRRPGGTPGCRRRRRIRRDRRAVRAARDGDGRGLRERLLGSGVAPERRAARAAEAAHRDRHRHRHGRSTHRRLRELPELPAPARLGVRAALRSAPRGLARSRSALHDRRHLRLASVEARPDRRLDRRVRALPVALPDRPGVVGGSGRPAEPARLGHRRDRAELPRLVRDRKRRRRSSRVGSPAGAAPA